ncbi:transmembrane protein, putative (macronuclear) [Tetrahymena thermophila SB210]|uniref:Transmembrane protein, putative n=1 Tax=Tetrahymena thermophila (strain SB210) TaxID=312017 RepID=W7X9N0_TETTS|nr:transmembrane protein, putative [Tetrahymena thermophila SB210]EWS73108.1 transmembrane protein, putative [Tetrahymena thermophila SB210]|eukprot:XP_012654357.1 transmembrane protein, putative [Tetrahymena thermophila SB210]
MLISTVQLFYGNISKHFFNSGSTKVEFYTQVQQSSVPKKFFITVVNSPSDFKLTCQVDQTSPSIIGKSSLIYQGFDQLQQICQERERMISQQRLSISKPFMQFLSQAMEIILCNSYSLFRQGDLIIFNRSLHLALTSACFLDMLMSKQPLSFMHMHSNYIFVIGTFAGAFLPFY